jgi:hypothetical protein
MSLPACGDLSFMAPVFAIGASGLLHGPQKRPPEDGHFPSALGCKLKSGPAASILKAEGAQQLDLTSWWIRVQACRLKAKR